MRSCVSLFLHLFVFNVVNCDPSIAPCSKTHLWQLTTQLCPFSLLESVSMARPLNLEWRSIVPIITITFVNWNDVWLSEIAAVEGFFFSLLLLLSLSASRVSPCGFALHITPDMVGRACKTQRAALQTSWNLLCVYSNNFTLWLLAVAAAMHVIVTEGILYRKTHWKVKDKVSLAFFFFCLVHWYCTFLFFVFIFA